MIFNLVAGYFIETLAVLLAITYLVLAVYKDIRCWLAWIASSFLYLYVMYAANLYMEACLQIFYIAMGFYGWSQWSKESQKNSTFVIKTWELKQHAIAISTVILLAFVSGWALDTYTNAALPFIDALTTWGAIVATYMVAQKLLENWIYWFVIDAISVVLFYSRELYLTSFLFFVYLFIIYFGYKSWVRTIEGMNDQRK
jgi:nicotinamide mononucleotide transporter|tara:strand:+ start:2010 stop:2606 length:597 start_codon:yes stop_codon:yes gene_type:complete